jgi:hypothetical protein
MYMWDVASKGFELAQMAERVERWIDGSAWRDRLACWLTKRLACRSRLAPPALYALTGIVRVHATIPRRASKLTRQTHRQDGTQTLRSAPREGVRRAHARRDPLDRWCVFLLHHSHPISLPSVRSQLSPNTPHDGSRRKKRWVMTGRG